ncbi:CoA pyrophosphatase [Fontimonas sp. SYSU GA230001]|uniref:CoA pyrophosphatase n=1 Tax=Fontimonas sp. SYSU GA230001 TaxID=3142450 RepID=UPI0032B572CA
MTSTLPVITSTDIERRLRGALAGTGLEAPRPLSGLELPFKLDRLLAPAVLGSLRPAAVLAPVIRRRGELSMLFTVRARHLRAHSGQISFPGGGRDDADRDAVDNALREAREEVGIDPARVEVIGYLDDYPTLTRYVVTPVVGLIEGEPELHIDANEVAEVFEAPLSFLLDPASYERRLLSRDGLNVPFFELNWQGHRIWGATAGMLWNLAQKVARR